MEEKKVLVHFLVAFVLLLFCLRLKLKLQYFGHLMQRAYSFKKTDARKHRI